MISINELKNDGKDVQQKKPFFPKMEVELGVQEEEVRPPKYQNKGSIMSMTTGNPMKQEESTMNIRQKADLSGLPEDENESLGVDKRESIQKDILGPGGIFEQYVVEQKAEMQQYLDDQELEIELSGESAVNSEEELEEEETIHIDNNSYKEIDIIQNMEKVYEPEEDLMEINGETKVIEEDNIVANVKETATVSDNDKTTIVTESVVEKEYHNIGFDEDDDIEISREMVKDDTVEDTDKEFEVEEISDDDSEESEQKRIEILKSMVTEKLKPISTRMNISGFTVAKKGTTSNNILEMKEIPVAKWPLCNTGIIVRMKEVLGTNLEKIRYSLSNNDVRTGLQIIYNHITSPKPGTLEAWAKTISFNDYDHLFMAMYIAAFADSNYIPIDCSNPLCKTKTYLTDSVDIMSMVKFKNEASKAKFMKIYQSEAVETKGLYATEIIPISEKIAIGFIDPSIYSVMIESGYFDTEFSRKYSDIITMLPFIDNLYEIDSVHHQLVPIEWKEYSNNIAKSVKSRVVRYSKIFATLNSDEMSVVKAYINEINNKSELLTYQIPETTCPHCGNVNKATEDQSASALVFLRNQLGLLVTT